MDVLAKVAVPIIPAEEENDQERTPLDVCVCPEGHMAPAGLGARRKGCSRASGEANCETQEGPWQLLGSNSHSLFNQLSCGFCLLIESPTVFPIVSLIYLFWPNPAPVNFSSLWPNNSSRRQMGKISVIWKTIQLSKRIDSPRAPGGCQVLYFVQFTKVLFVQYQCVSIDHPNLH